MRSDPLAGDGWRHHVLSGLWQCGVGAVEPTFPRSPLSIYFEWGDMVMRLMQLRAQVRFDDEALGVRAMREVTASFRVANKGVAGAPLSSWVSTMRVNTPGRIMVAPRQLLAVELRFLESFEERFMWRFMEEELAGNIGWGVVMRFAIDGVARAAGTGGS